LFSILHTADVHLDRAFGGSRMPPSVAAARRTELRDAFRRFIDLALERQVDAVTIGGDLYEHDRCTADTGHFLRQQLERLATIPAFIAPGNHDPYVPESLYRQIDWPPNVTIFSEPAFRSVPLGEGLKLWGAGHDGPALRDNLLQDFRVAGPGRHILLFHGSDTHAVPEGKTTHAPFQPADIGTTGAQFALLGHYHQARLSPSDNPLFAYPGTPEPLGFDEEGDHSVLLVQISDDAVHPQLLPFGGVTYRTLRLDISSVLTSDEIRAAIESFASAGDGTTAAPIVRIILEGQLQPEVDLDRDALLNACAERFSFLDIVDSTYPAYDFEELAQESTTKGTFVRLLRHKMETLSGPDLVVAQDALVYGLDAFDKREVRPR
jgi:DNA repair exonuclease SbcCD nuclease subunit